MSGAGAAETAVHGWGCTPTGDAPEPARPRFLPAAFVRGWQRTALYVILIALMLLVFLNLALSLWIIASLRLTMKGVGPIKIVPNGIKVEGQSLITDRLVASNIASHVGQPITLHAHRNFSIVVSEPELKETSRLTIKRDSLECGGRTFEVTDARGATIFRASREEVRVQAEVLSAESAGGVTVKGAVQVPHVRAPPGFDLTLESQTRRLDLRAPQSIYLESRAGSIDITSHGNIKLDSIVGAIKIDSPNIYMGKLKEAVATSGDGPRSKSSRGVKVYQVCVCASGKMFLAAPDGLCAAHNDDVELCR